MELLELTRENTQINPALSAHLCDRIERDFIQRWNGPWGGRSLVHGRDPGPNSVRLNGNDYLNLTGRPEIVMAQSCGLVLGRRVCDPVGLVSAGDPPGAGV